MYLMRCSAAWRSAAGSGATSRRLSTCPAAFAAAGLLMLGSLSLHFRAPRGEASPDTSPATCLSQSRSLRCRSTPRAARAGARRIPRRPVRHRRLRSGHDAAAPRAPARRRHALEPLPGPRRAGALGRAVPGRHLARASAPAWRAAPIADTAIFERVRALHRGDEPPAVTHLIRREPGAFVPTGRRTACRSSDGAAPPSCAARALRAAAQPVFSAPMAATVPLDHDRHAGPAARRHRLDSVAPASSCR